MIDQFAFRMRSHVAWRSMVVLAAALTGLGHVHAQRRLPVATVHVEVFGPFGSTIRASKVRLFTLDRKRDLAGEEGRTTISGVPYGQYILVVSDSGGAMAERELVVNSKEVWVRVGLPFPAGDRAWPGGDLTISGTISPAPTNPKDWWARVEGVFLHFRKESPIGSSGQFLIGGLEMGTYLVEVFEGAKLRHVETIEIDTKTPTTHVDIVLSESLPHNPRPDRNNPAK